MALGRQLRLTLDHPAQYDRARFVVAPSNRDATLTLDSWPGAEGGALALIGPEGSGKTHLAMAWALRVGAVVLRPEDLEGTLPLMTPLVLEDADRVELGEAFFHLLNRAALPGSCLLLTGRDTPGRWAAAVPDLRSRLNALPVIELGAVDDAILRGVLVGLFQQRNIRPPTDLLDYLLKRIERSTAAAAAIVAALDDASHADHRPVSRVLARQILKDDVEEPGPAP
jgi:chromosomal replication initiation ATPase DnaA